MRTAGFIDDATMASVIIAACCGCAAGGGIAGVVSWLTGGSRDQYGKDAHVYKDDSKSLVHLPANSWSTELIVAIVFIAISIHFLGSIWGWLGGRKHAKESANKDHAIHLANLKADHANSMGKFLANEAVYKHQLNNMKETIQHLRAESERKVNALTSRHLAETQKHDAELKATHAAYIKMAQDIQDSSEEEEEEHAAATHTLDRASRREAAGAQGGAVPRSTSVPAATHQQKKKKKKIPVEEYLKNQ